MKTIKYLIARKEPHEKESYYNALILDWVTSVHVGTLFDSIEKAQELRMNELIYSTTYIVKVTTQVEKVK